MADVRIFLTTTGAGTWTVPDDWVSSGSSIEAIGAGANGRGYTEDGHPYSGGGGGGYSKISNLTLTPGDSIPYSVGANGSVGGDTWFGNASYASSNVGAKGGNIYTGGQSSSGIGTVKYSGGSSTTVAHGTGAGLGGGGAGGPNGNGGAGLGDNWNGSRYVGGTGGRGDSTFGGLGGTESQNGSGGTEWDSTHGCGGGGGGSGDTTKGGDGGLYGAGGGGGTLHKAIGVGSQGLIVITYTPAVTGSSNFFQLF